MDLSNMDWSDIYNTVCNYGELGIYNLSPINEINPNQDFNLKQGNTKLRRLQDLNPQQENTDLGPLQDLNLQQEIREPELLPPHVETSYGHQLNQASEPSPEPRRRGRTAKLSESQRKLNKKKSDEKHRQKLKNILTNAKEVTKEKEDIEKQAGEMKAENERQLNYIQLLEKEINKLKSERDVLMSAVQGHSVDVNKMIMELFVCQPCNATVPAAAAEFFKKLEEDEESNVDFKDFTITDLHEKQEYRTVGKYQIPLSLVPTAEKITEVYGDVCATSTISRIVAGKIYILFCATIKEMSELPLERVTEKTMLKWRDAIKDALCIKFKVEFAMEHLKKTMAPRYFGMKACEEVKKIDVDISKVEAYLNGLKECRKFIDFAKEFDDKPFSEGLWG